MSDKRLVSLLSQAGVDSDEVEVLDRNAMIDRWAKLVAAGGGKTPKAGGGAAAAKALTAGYDVELERNRLAFEREKFEFEKTERERLAAIEKEKIESAERQAEKD